MVEHEANELLEAEAQERPNAAERKRIQSGIEFPYSDLESAAELARTLRVRVAGGSADDNELAAWLNQTASGGTYRSRRSAAKLFGLIDIQQGRVVLTDLGRDHSDSRKERAARVEAFLRPELFKVMYEHGRGHILPPAPAIERQIEQLGVSPKQKGRARQVFYKSAVYAGFIDTPTGRFVKPGNGAPEQKVEEDDKKIRDSGGGGGGGGGPQDQLIQALIQKLPQSGKWPAQDRAIWLKMATMAFDLVYGRDGEIDIKTRDPQSD